MLEYKVVRIDKFEASKKKLIKTHYKKDKRSRHRFECIVSDFLADLKNNPAPTGASLQEIPNKSKSSFVPRDCEFRKMRWPRLPGLSGAARRGRCLYLVFTERKRIYLLWMYTHEEHPKQPPHADLQKIVKGVISYVEENFPLDSESSS